MITRAGAGGRVGDIAARGAPARAGDIADRDVGDRTKPAHGSAITAGRLRVAGVVETKRTRCGTYLRPALRRAGSAAALRSAFA